MIYKNVCVGAMLILAIPVLSLIQACAGAVPDRLKELEAVEVKEYQGEKLGSIADFHENSVKGPQFVDISTYQLKITGLVDNPLSYTYGDVIDKHKAYTKLLTIDCVEGWSVKILWEGLQLKDLLQEASVKPSAKVVIFHGYDGYTTSLPLQYVLDKNLLLAFKMNGVILPPETRIPVRTRSRRQVGLQMDQVGDRNRIVGRYKLQRVLGKLRLL